MFPRILTILNPVPFQLSSQLSCEVNGIQLYNQLKLWKLGFRIVSGSESVTWNWFPESAVDFEQVKTLRQIHSLSVGVIYSFPWFHSTIFLQSSDLTRFFSIVLSIAYAPDAELSLQLGAILVNNIQWMVQSVCVAESSTSAPSKCSRRFPTQTSMRCNASSRS